MGNRLAIAAAGLQVVIGLASFDGWALPIDRVITIQPITVCNDAGASCATPVLDEALIDKVFTQAGIDMVFLPMRQLNKSQFLATTIEDTAPTRLDEWRRLLREPGNQQSANPTTLNTYFVQQIQFGASSVLGVSFINGNGIVVSNAALIDTLAHEIGHNLGLDHLTFGNNPPDASNLMTNGGGPVPRLRPASIADVNPDGAQRSKLTGGITGGQIQQARAPLFSVGTNQARIQGTPAGFDLERFTLSLAGINTGQSLDKLKVFVAAGGPAGARLVTLAGEALPAFIDRGLCSRATCWVETRRTLVDGTIEITFDFLDGLITPTTSANFMMFPSYETQPFGEPVAAAPFSFTFEFANGYSSQAGFDVLTRSAASDDPLAVTSWIGEPRYGPPAGSLPEPTAFELHLVANETPVPVPPTFALLAGTLVARVALRGRRDLGV